MQWIFNLFDNNNRKHIENQIPYENQIEELKKERDILCQELHQIYKEKEDLHRNQRDLELILANIQNEELLNDDFAFVPPIPQFTRRKISNDEYIIHASCPICLERFEYNVEYPALQCGHIFHQKCINRWLSDNEICPVCRQYTD